MTTLLVMFNVSAHIWLYSLPSNTFLQYIVWTSFPLVLVTFSVGFTYLVSPHAIGKSFSSLSYVSGNVIIRSQFVIQPTALYCFISNFICYSVVCTSKNTQTSSIQFSLSLCKLMNWASVGFV